MVQPGGMVTALASGYRIWVPMNVISLSFNPVHFRSLAQAGGVCLLVMALLGCLGADTKKDRSGFTKERSAKGGSAAGLAKLQFSENQQESALYELVYSNAGTKEIADVCYAQGQFLMNDKGVFRFEQRKKEPQRAFIVYFNPEHEILIVFPKLNIVYKASPEVLSGAQGERLVAAYDGLRMALCLSNVWNNPEANSLESGDGGDSLFLQQPGRPFRWNVDMDAVAAGSPITRLRARKGWREVCTLQHNANSIQQFSRANKDAYMHGGSGQLGSGNQWSLSFPGNTRQSEFIFNPYPMKKDDAGTVRELFSPPTIDTSFQVQELTLDLILDWMGIR